MDINNETEKKTVSIIQEIEAQLENYLRRQHEEIEKKLDQRIQEERELARQQLAQIEEEVKKEWQALEEYGQLWEQFEEERNQILQKIREYFSDIVERQKKIEELARETSEDIKAINELQDRLEEIRGQSMEKSAFLKHQLEEKFGLRSEVLEKSAEPVEDIDLTAELEKLQKVKELLMMESESKEERASPVSQPESEMSEANETKAGQEAEAGGEVEIEVPAANESELTPAREPTLEEKLAEEIKKGLVEKMNSASTLEGDKADNSETGDGSTDRQYLVLCYHQESANGSGRIGYYQKDDHCVFEVQEILNRIRKTVEEAKKAYHKLNLVSSVKEQFFLKRELIAEQEGLRKYLQKVFWLIEKKGFTFPLLASDILNQTVVEELVELLRTQNWGAPEDLNHFEQKIQTVISSFDERVNPPSVYYSTLRKELDT
ncbi:MAG TPA: hypothetical protein PLP57_08050 [Candidatus Saccharicenans sp.]|nr:hypothetical protein [Candidatus Saccharicenans sp.]HRD02576.1 hypothetical protein [Candidatus Saccharicenans sp.]